ncbi:MAG TPA: homoserine kinase [bacterium]
MVKVRVPASTSNLGSGFDCLAMALNLYLRVEMGFNTKTEIQSMGKEGSQIPTTADNLILQAARKIFAKSNQPFPNLRIRIENEIPLFRGLGSSGAATVAGLLCGNVLANARAGLEEILLLANEFEGHPENAAASLLGGATINCLSEGRIIAKRFQVDENLAAVLLIPDATIATHEARAVLPRTVNHSDAVFNLQRSALLAHALISRDYDALKCAMQDRLHQPFRKKLIPYFDEFETVGYDCAALGVCISGSGSAILGICLTGESTILATAWTDLRMRLKLGGEVLTRGFENRGAEIVGAEC